MTVLRSLLTAAVLHAAVGAPGLRPAPSPVPAAVPGDSRPHGARPDEERAAVTGVSIVPGAGAASGTTVRVHVGARLDRAGAAVLIGFPPEESEHMADDKMLREMTSDPKFRKILVTDGKTEVGQALVKALAKAGDALDNCYFSDHYSQEDKRPEVVEFLKKYQAEYGKTPDSMAALGYDAANLLFDAMEKSPSLGGKDLAKTVASTNDYKAVTGNISINENRDAEKLAVIQKIMVGKFSYFATVEPAK